MGCRGLPGCSIIRASLPFANIGVLRAGRAQPLYLLTPAGRFALRATAHRADASLRCAHGFAAPLRVALGLWPKCPQGTRFPSRLAGVWGRLPVAQSSRRAPAAPTARFAPSQISAFCALSARSPCICSRLRVALRCAQQPTGLTLPSGAPAGRFALCATAHRADASLRCPKPCAAAQKSERCECPKGTRNAPRSTPPRISAQTARPSSTRRGRAASIQKTLSLERPAFLASLRSLATLDGLCRRKRRHPPASSCIKPRFSRPFGRSQRSTGFAAGSAVILPRLPASSRVSRVPSVARNARRALPPEAPSSSRVFLHQAAFLASLRSLATLDGLCRRKRRRPPLIPASSRVSCVPVAQSFALPCLSQISAFCALPRTALVFAHAFGSLCALRNSPQG